ncbi:MAG: MATE family efflux transporter [Bacteroidales bacterium]|nr:MATE family efflux transporter [Candidatus Liminaster caballi]
MDRLEKIRSGASMTRGEQIRLAASLSVPAMLSQLSTIVMQYIDASMVGSLGARASAAIGIVSTTTWLFGGLCHSVGAGFYVQVAHQIGANRFAEARQILRQSLLFALTFSVVLAAVGLSIAPSLPRWLGGAADIRHDASLYFAVFASMLPFMMLMALSAGMLRCSGNIKVPSILNVVACALDVVFNYVFIFRLGMGVMGAAIGTASAYCSVSLIMAWYLLTRSRELSLLHDSGTFRPQGRTVRKWFRIAWPMGVEHFVMCGAQIASTVIIAPLGTVAIAANAFGIIVESLCYMPGHGIADAATTLVGQSLGAQRQPLARSFAHITVAMGIGVMSLMGLVMYVGAPYVMSFMTPDVSVQELTARILRIEAFAEPGYAAAIVAYGVFVGAGDTLIPCTMNLASIWVVRISLAIVCTQVLGLGLVGVWTAMAVELCFRGAIFLFRLRGNAWMRKMGG